MAGDKDKTADEQPADEEQGPVCGERLAAARREQKISVLEVAKELHLDETKVRALEHNDFDLLGPPVFAKGHLRKYAQLVGIDEADVFTDYYKLTRSMRVEPVVIGRSSMRREPSPGPWIAAIAVILVVASAYWWFAARDPGSAKRPVVTEQSAAPEQAERTEQPEQAEQAEQPELPEAASNAATDSENATVMATAAAESELPEAGAAAAEAVPVAAAEPDGEELAVGGLRLALTFSGDCWTEITDADGQRLFFGMGRSGRTAELTGRAPIRVLFGNADNVSVQVNGADYSIPAPDPDNRTAILTIRSP